MRFTHGLLSALSLALAACGASTPAASTPEGEAAGALGDTGLRLRAEGDVLRIDAPNGRHQAPQGSLFYVLGAEILPDQRRPRIGVVEVIDPSNTKVTWYCSPRSPAPAPLAEKGLPVEPLKPNPEHRAGGCWGSYQGQAIEAWKKSTTSMAYLPLNLGADDGVKGGDSFEVLANPAAQKSAWTAGDFKTIGRCSIQPIDISAHASVCKLDIKVWPAFNREAWTRGGFVRRVKEPVRPAP
jgi:hypothetical protein